ncbi:PREDICTED: DNA-directed RNA polymerase IV subunit 1-like [Ipomoea nil]|uniref:DNA-directed RNA polymerase IV subunit 1-like n=1 Tax=Ipomoea nil TaxID=35883 RepID=UPI000900AB4D|nr:PREDICTED: DNA-directed RNA polymerase IV subunit 1-like [Ipomoea nil]
MRLLTHAQVYSILKEIDSGILEATFKRKNSMFVNCLPLTPNCHRVMESQSGDMQVDESSRLYKKLIDFKGTANDLSVRVLDCTKITKLRVEKRPSVNESSRASGSGLKFVKELIIGKRTDHAFRMVVVGDPKINLWDIGIPRCVAESLQIGERLNCWNSGKLSEVCHLVILQNGSIPVRRNGGPVRIKASEKLRIGDVVYRPLVDGDIVLINRPPSIHQHSLIALFVKILPVDSVVSVNPLICDPLRGDFDGDCLHGFVPQSIDSSVELRELVGLKKQLTDGQSGLNLLALSHDSLTAAHLIMEDGVFLNRFQMQQLQMLCPLQLQFPNIIKRMPVGSFSWTGKELFSMLLPSDFDYDFPSNGVRISQGEIISSSGSSWLGRTDGNLFDSLVKRYGEEALQFLNTAQDVLCEWLSMRGLSVSLSDIYLSDPDTRKNMLDDISCGLQEVERLSHISQLMEDYYRDFLVECSEGNENCINFEVEQQKSVARSQASIFASKREFRNIQSLFYNYASKENSLLAMLKAGSKGNLLKAVQHSMCLGLQHASVLLSFEIPYNLSCVARNGDKFRPRNIPEYSGSYIPCAVVKNSFLAGLNPLECFVHSLTTRESSFGGHADVSGTLTRTLMFFMRDLYTGYDGTVRNAYGNHVVQFSYHTEDPDHAQEDHPFSPNIMAGHPVGSLAACAISEAAYSALDQPISTLEPSPLLNLKKVLESGVQKRSGGKTASLFLSRKLRRWAYGFEYGALGVKSHLERVLFSDIVSTVMIWFSPEKCRDKRSSPWICHFHVNKEIAKKRGLKLQSITNALNRHYKAAKVKPNSQLPSLQIMCEDCYLAGLPKEDTKFCITASIVGVSKRPAPDCDILRDVVMPFLLGTVVKGFPAFKKVDILWKDGSVASQSSKRSSGELYLRVFMSENCARAKFWSELVDSCLQIMEMIDWERSHPDDIHDISGAYGIDVAWISFLSGLSSTISEIGKKIVPEHLVLTADYLSSTGEFIALNSKGLADQRKANGLYAPFSQACLKSPGEAFVKAAKMETVDDLRGSAEALILGKTPPIGTGFHFDILYSGKGHEPLSKSTDVYSLLSSNATLRRQYGMVNPKGNNEIPIKSLPQHLSKAFSLDDIKKLSLALKNILSAYRINEPLRESDKSVVMKALSFHPKWEEKIGTGAQEIKVGQHEKHQSRCFVVERSDGTSVDFSYHKCVQNALELVAPEKAKSFRSR